jgi:hypothetical protein
MSRSYAGDPGAPEENVANQRRGAHVLGYHPPVVSSPPPAKFFVNRGIVASRADMDHLLRPLLKQTVTYRYFRGRDVVSHGTGWVERIVLDQPDVSSYFTPLSICVNIDSFEHLEFETRPDQFIVYSLIQGDEKVVLEFAPGAARDEGAAGGAEQLEFDTSGFVQMELQGMNAPEVEQDQGAVSGGDSGATGSSSADGTSHDGQARGDGGSA